MKYRIEGQCPAKKSSHEIRRKISKSFLVPDKSWIAPNEEQQAWERDAAKQLMIQKSELGIVEALKYPLHVRFLIYRSGTGRADLTNLTQSCEDALEAGAVISDDFLIESTDGSRRFYVPEGKERIEIEIRPYHDTLTMAFSQIKKEISMAKSQKKNYEIKDEELELLADDLLVKLCFMLEEEFCTEAFKTKAKMILKQAVKDIFSTSGVKLKS